MVLIVVIDVICRIVKLRTFIFKPIFLWFHSAVTHPCLAATKGTAQHRRGGYTAECALD